MIPAADPLPVSTHDPVNARILAVSEDRIAGFSREPVAEISRLSGVDAATVIERIRAMLRAGTIRRVRQTLVANDLAPGALVAWSVPQEKVERGVRLSVQGRPVQRPRGGPLDRPGDRGLPV